MLQKISKIEVLMRMMGQSMTKNLFAETISDKIFRID